jgi:dolichol-phosphate mannosyltransferase
VVGAMGTIVNLGALTLFVTLRVPIKTGIAAAILVSICFNFVLNRRFSFSFARSGPWPRQFLRFVGASLTGAIINYGLTLTVLRYHPAMHPQLAALIGIAVATVFNFAATRYLVFRALHVRASNPPNLTSNTEKIGIS